MNERFYRKPEKFPRVGFFVSQEEYKSAVTDTKTGVTTLEIRKTVRPLEQGEIVILQLPVSAEVEESLEIDTTEERPHYDQVSATVESCIPILGDKHVFGGQMYQIKLRISEK
jgi:hypothetical protein